MTTRQQEEELFEAARALNSAARERFLGEACAGNASLRAEIDQLLTLDREADRAFAEPIDLGECFRDAVSAIGPQVKDAIGPYKLIRIIGEGGCGTVYLAEQLEPIHRRIALKVIKAGMDTASVIARFEAERQALALMEHPNIAKVFDAGSTDTGRPYFVMELVEGQKITDYCTAHQLSINDRLHLFLQICDAVQHAHQKGIIHRDLKPSNILCGEAALDCGSPLALSNSTAARQGGQELKNSRRTGRGRLASLHSQNWPMPKIIDFGIAKAISGRLTKETIHTLQHQFLGTPAYMSPEQADLSPDIDTRADIYSLGALLYELLTGKPPFDNQELLTSGLDGMRRIIREVEPKRPGQFHEEAVLSRLNCLESATRNPQSAIPSDLDWIVMKCLEKDRSRRYDTARSLAADLSHYLENEPVLACPPTAYYRLSKFARKHVVPLFLATTALAALMFTLVVSLWQADRARRAERVARQEADGAKAVKDYITEQLVSANIALPDSDPDPRKALVLEVAEKQLQGRFKDQPLVEADIRFALGQGLSGSSDFTNQLASFERAYNIRRERLGLHDPQTLEALACVARCYLDLGRIEHAEQLLREAQTSLDDVGTNSIATAAIAAARGELLFRQERYAEAVPIFNKAVQMLRGAGALQRDIAACQARLVVMLIQSNQLKEAEPLAQNELADAERTLPPKHPALAEARKRLGLVYLRLRRGAEAIPLLVQSHRALYEMLGPDNRSTLDALWLMGWAYEQVGQTNMAISIYQQVVPKSGAYLPNWRTRVFEVAEWYVPLGLLDNARSAYKLLIDSFQTHPPHDGADRQMFAKIVEAAGRLPPPVEHPPPAAAAP